MDARTLLTDAFGRIRDLVPAVVEGIDPAALTWRPDPEANTIAWLLWHLARVQDDHIADIAGHEQVWVEEGWAERFGLSGDRTEIGYGHTPQQVAEVRPDGVEAITTYHAQVAERTRCDLQALDVEDLDRVIDRSFDPPVTVAVRLISIVGDALQHVGQAAYLRGMFERGA